MTQPQSSVPSQLQRTHGHAAHASLQRDDSAVLRSPHAAASRSLASQGQDAFNDTFRMRSKPTTPRGELPTFAPHAKQARFMLPDTGLRVRTALGQPAPLLSPRHLKGRKRQQLLCAAGAAACLLLVLVFVVSWRVGSWRFTGASAPCELKYATLLAQRLAGSAVDDASAPVGQSTVAPRVAIVSFRGWRRARLRPNAAAFAGALALSTASSNCTSVYHMRASFCLCTQLGRLQHFAASPLEL